jgi:hypothetical protein
VEERISEIEDRSLNYDIETEISKTRNEESIQDFWDTN